VACRPQNKLVASACEERLCLYEKSTYLILHDCCIAQLMAGPFRASISMSENAQDVLGAMMLLALLLTIFGSGFAINW
jgi:hypothetical protein